MCRRRGMIYLSTWRRVVVSACVLSSLASSAAALDPAAERERRVRAFQACAACHHERSDATGPDLRTVLNRSAGSVAGYRYSNAMKRAKLVWTIDNLRAFLRDPQAVVRGNRMPFPGMTDPAQLEDVIAYLRAE